MRMKNLGSPNNIEVLLHYYVSPEPHPRRHAPAVDCATNDLLRAGAIVPRADHRGTCFQTTELGCAWVAALCQVPPPTAVWVDEQGRTLK